MVIKERKPLKRDEVLAYLNEDVERNINQWGEDYIYTEWAKENRDKMLQEYDNGKVVKVYSEEYVDSYGSGCGNFMDTLYSDGHVETSCFGGLD